MALHFPAAAYLSGREPWAAQPEDRDVGHRVEPVSPDKVLGAAGSCVRSPGTPMPGCKELSAALQMETWRHLALKVRFCLSLGSPKKPHCSHEMCQSGTECACQQVQKAMNSAPFA